MIYVLASSAGALLGWASTEAELPAPPANSVVLSLASWDAPPPLPYVWTPSLFDWAVPASTEKLSVLDFQWRYTLAEQVAIERAEQEHADPNVRATLKILSASLARVTEASGVKTNDPRTVSGVQYHASLGLIAPERVADILA